MPFLGDRQVYTTHVSYIFDMLTVFKLQSLRQQVKQLLDKLFTRLSLRNILRCARSSRCSCCC